MISPKIQQSVSLADHTSLGVGGLAKSFTVVSSTDELLGLLQSLEDQENVWVLGYGCNSLISDNGLDGLVISLQGGKISISDSEIIIDAGVWWDDVVKESIEHGLWGLELMSQIPGSTGAALYINITAYGQFIGSKVLWIDVWNPKSRSVKRIQASDLNWEYKNSVFQSGDYEGCIILRTCLGLSHKPTEELTYQKAIDVAKELNLDPNSLQDRRVIIIESRKRAGSIWHPDSSADSRTAGSFFRNPIVSSEVAKFVMNYDESGKTAEQIKKMNKVHGGDEKRVSAAHVMLAAGFSRGDRWGNVKLNDQNLLKIEALPGASAQEIYDVAQNISRTCEQKIGIALEPEVRLLGEF